jgi:hypothetical protein
MCYVFPALKLCEGRPCVFCVGVSVHISRTHSADDYRKQ